MKIRKKSALWGIALLLSIGLFTACTQTEAISTTKTSTTTLADGYDENDFYTDFKQENPVAINLSDHNIDVDHTAVSVTENTVTIRSTGTYVLSGTLNDGQIIVDAGDQDVVRLVLNNATLASTTSAPIDVKNADKTIVSLPEGTVNTLTDGSTDTNITSEDATSAALFSKDDLTLNGTGTLTLNANNNDGIVSKDTLKIMEGNLNITAVDDTLIGRDALKVKDGTLTLTAGGDGLKSTNDTETDKGNIVIHGGTLNITAGGDGLQGQTAVTIVDGTFNFSTGGGSANAIDQTQTGGFGKGGGAPSEATQSTDTEDTSTKGIKCAGAIDIKGGTFTLDTEDDTIHSNSDITFSGGHLNITSGDDGIHADTSLIINDGTIDIKKSYEGLESSTVTISGGTINVKASDDGINVAGGNDASSQNGRPGENNFSETGSSTLHLDGGDVTVDADGDGLDANGSIIMTGGNVIVYGPTNSGNGALDYDGTFEISGGFLVAVGSSEMVQSPSSGSTQCVLNATFPTTLNSGTTVNLNDATGTILKTISPTKSFKSFILSTPDLQNGNTYSIDANGSTLGTFSISDSITNLNSSGTTNGGQQGAPTNGGPGGARP